MEWHKTKEQLPDKDKVAVVVSSSLTDVGIDVGCSNTDYIRAHPEEYSDWAYIEMPSDFHARKHDRIKREYGEEQAQRDYPL